jgi:hypothetical protein
MEMVLSRLQATLVAYSRLMEQTGPVEIGYYAGAVPGAHWKEPKP